MFTCAVAVLCWVDCCGTCCHSSNSDPYRVAGCWLLLALHRTAHEYAVTAGDAVLGPIKWWHMGGGGDARVWYAEVLFFFSVQIPAGRTFQFAYVQWYEAFGGPFAGGRRHKDTRFPAALERRFPRVYLPEHELGQRYEVLPIEHILSPAPISDDVSLVHCQKTRAEIAALEVEAAVRTGKRALPEESKWNTPLIPWENNCPTVAAKRSCTDARCTWLHDDQMAGADQEKTKLRVVNLLVVQMSRGTWNPQWKLPGPPPRHVHVDLHSEELRQPPGRNAGDQVPEGQAAIVYDMAPEQVRCCQLVVYLMGNIV
jgi:hypothetical protein